jgi:hypothetical protein
MKSADYYAEYAPYYNTKNTPLKKKTKLLIKH